MGHDNLTSLEVADAGGFRGCLFERSMSSSSSVKLFFSFVRAVINLAIGEHGLPVTDVFSGTFITDGELNKKRLPIPAENLVKIQKKCMVFDDYPHRSVALISDTGMRLSKATGLAREDIVLDADIPML